MSPKIFWNEQRSFVLPAAYGQTPWHSLGLALATRSPRGARWVAERALARSRRQMAGDTTFTVNFMAGAVLLLRRSAVVSAGGLFDPDYFMFFEDSDLSLRLRRGGHVLAVAPAASAVHEYRHKAFKGALMAQSQQQYFSKQFPRFYRWSNQLARLGALARPMLASEWYQTLPRPISSAQDFAQQTQGARVLAFSPSTLMLPAIFRPSFAQARSFDDEEWALLEPAAYTVLLQGAGAPQWCYFERASSD